MSIQLEELTKEQLEEKVANGEYIKEELFNKENGGENLTQNIRKFDYFNVMSSFDSTDSSIQSTGWISTSTKLDISNTSMQVTYNNETKIITIGDEGDFTSLTYSQVGNAVSSLLLTKFTEVFHEGAIEVRVMSISGGRMIKVVIQPDYGVLTVNSNNGDNSLLSLLKFTEGQTCVCITINSDLVYTKLYNSGYPFENELCKGIGYFIEGVMLNYAIVEDKAGTTHMLIDKVYGYRPKRKIIYTYRAANE